MINLFALLLSMWTDRRAATAAITVILLPILLGTAGLVTEYGYGLVRKVENQRVADAAAYSGALAYNTTITTSDGTAAMTASAVQVAALNGIAASQVVVALVPSPATATNSAVQVTLTDSVPLVFSRLLQAKSSLAVINRATVELTTEGQACVVQLNGGLNIGIGLDLGAVLNALLCAVSVNAAVSIPCGTGINTSRLSISTALPPDAPCNGLQAPVNQILKLLSKQATDPYALDVGIVAANARVTLDALLLSPLMVIANSGGDLTFGAGDLSVSLVTLNTLNPANHCGASKSGTIWTLTCTGTTLNFGKITVSSGYSLNFNTTGAATTQYTISAGVTNNGAIVRFPAGTFNIGQGIRTAAGSTTSFGSGAINVTAPLLTPACIDGGYYSICNAGTLSVAGPIAITLTSGIYNAANASATLGTGTANSFRVGTSSNGYALHAARPSKTIFGDASGTGTYQINGDIVGDGAAGTSGSCLVIGASSQHDINGNLLTADATVFGAGTYTVTGTVLLGINGTIDANCNGSTTGVSAANVTFVVGGAGSKMPSSGPCKLDLFCVAPGYQSVVFTAPTTAGPLAKVALVGPQLSAGGVLFTDGLANTSFSGLLYAPAGPVTITGSASIGNGVGQCLELVVNQLFVHGGNIFAAPCKSGAPTIRGTRLVD